MSTFDTPESISATIELAVGEVQIAAADRITTRVEVQPSDASDKDDVRAAEQTHVEYAAGRLVIKAPKLRSWLSRNRGPSVHITVELPAGSNVSCTGQVADIRFDGLLGDCRIKTGIGQIAVDQAEALNIKSGAGAVTVDHATGRAEITAGSGEVRARELDQGAAIKNANGATWVGAAGDGLSVKASNGSVVVDVANGDVEAKSANGGVRVGEVVRGSVVLETHLGDVEVGVREGTAVWLDVSTHAGKVHNALENAEAPGQSAETVELRARTSVGAIVIGRP